MNLKELKEMIELMNDNGLAEIELERDGMKVKVKKNSAQASSGQPLAYTLPTIPVASAVSAPAAVPARPGPALAAAETPSHLKDVKSPMVGTFLPGTIA